MENSARKNESIGGSFLDVEITPIENGIRLDSFIREVYVMADYEDLPKNKRKTNVLKHIVETVKSCLPAINCEARFSINGIDFYFEKENGAISTNYVRFSTRATYITPIN